MSVGSGNKPHPARPPPPTVTVAAKTVSGVVKSTVASDNVENLTLPDDHHDSSTDTEDSDDSDNEELSVSVWRIESEVCLVIAECAVVERGHWGSGQSQCWASGQPQHWGSGQSQHWGRCLEPSRS